MRVFVLGSGFSKSCGYPTTKGLFGHIFDYIDGNNWGNLETYKDICLEALSDLGVDISKKEEVDFELLLLKIKEFSKIGKDKKGIYIPLRDILKQALKTYFYKLLLDNSQKIGPALNFVRNIRKCRKICRIKSVIISFNWDLLLECAIKKIGDEYNYGLVGGGTLILKPHGSINWMRTADYKGMRVFDTFEDYDPQYKMKGIELMIMPGDKGKPEIRELQKIWDQVETVFSEANEIIFIGYSLPDYDTYSLDVLKTNVLLRYQNSQASIRITVVNPNQNDVKKFKTLFGNSIAVEPCGFEYSKHALE